jgi:predicted anti-sigma-YlaC factor YlaD
VHGHCERARQWASLELDGELSTFERALLDAHVEGCASCGEFRAEIGSLTGALRAAPHERFEGVVIGRMRRRARMRLAPAAAAMAVAAVGLGSVLASSSFQGSSVGRLAAQSVDVSPDTASAATAPDTMNLSTSKALATLRARTSARIAPRKQGSLRGGPVVSQR